MPDHREHRRGTRLIYALTARSVLLLAVVGALLAALQTITDFRLQQVRVRGDIDSFIAASRPAARKAAFLLDPSLAQQMMLGFSRFGVFSEATLIDDQGAVLARYRRPIDASLDPAAGSLGSWILGLLGDRLSYQRVVLNAENAAAGSAPLGELRLVIDNHVALSEVVHRAESNFIISLAGYTVFCLALGLLFHRFLARPLLQLAQRLRELDIQQLQVTRIDPIPGHETDELGLIIDANNDMLARIAGDRIALGDRSKRIRLILDSAPSIIFSVDERFRIGFANLAAARFYGESATQLTGSAAQDTIGRQDPALYSLLTEFSRDRSRPSERGTERITGACGDRIAQITFTRFEDSSGEKILVSAEDISERVEAERKIEALAYYDQLTGLPNRNSALRQFDGGGPWPRRRFGIAVIADVDNFRRINDTMGLGLGDRLMMRLAQRFSADFSDVDLLARCGDDEFLLVRQAVSDTAEGATEAALQLGNAVRSSFAREIALDTGSFTLTASIGVVGFDSSRVTAQEVLRCADTAMFEAKKAGRNRVALYKDEMALSATELLKREHEARRAIAQGDFLFQLQPIFCARSGQLESAEALMRWRTDEGPKPPAGFIPFLEESGLIVDVGYSLLGDVCAYLVKMERRGILPEGFRIAVNISARQLLHPAFVDTVEQIVNHHALAFSRLQFEITESLALDHMEHALDGMERLVTLGVRFSLDDFGTGYSSLAYLKELPVDKLKLDRSFVCNIGAREQDEKLLRSVIQLAETLGHDVVAEGVETREQADWLADHGNRLFFQGFYFGRPVDPEVFSEQFLLAEIHGAAADDADVGGRAG